MVDLKTNLSDGDILNHEDFRKLIPKDVYDLCVEVSREGFSLTLVGGAVRDWLMTGHLPQDLDFELRHTFEYDEKEWSFRVNRLGERLREVYRYNVEFLSFSILRITWPGANYEVELGPARIESYVGQDSYGHSDFKETLVSCAPYSQTFKRRDFTINALGIEFGSVQTTDEFKLVDPFGGVSHLKTGVLKNCSDDFPKDPVRFCRGVRFSIKYNLSFDTSLEALFKEFHLEKLTCFYFFREAFKTDFFKFSQLFFSLIKTHSIPISEELEKLKFLGDLQGQNLQLYNEKEVLFFLVYHEDFENRIEDIEAYCHLSKTKVSTYKAHRQFKATLGELDNFEEKEFLDSIPHMSFEDFLKHPQVNNLKSFHQFVSRVGREPLAILGRLNSHLYANFLKVYEILPASLLGKELFEELLQEKEVAPEQRGLLQYFAHFKEQAKQ